MGLGSVISGATNLKLPLTLEWHTGPFKKEENDRYRPINIKNMYKKVDSPKLLIHLVNDAQRGIPTGNCER